MAVVADDAGGQMDDDLVGFDAVVLLHLLLEQAQQPPHAPPRTASAAEAHVERRAGKLRAHGRVPGEVVLSRGEGGGALGAGATLVGDAALNDGYAPGL
jgi:hypothetical protein